MALLRLTSNLKNLPIYFSSPRKVPQRRIALSSVQFVKEIKETREGKTTFIEGVIKESPRTPYLIKHTDKSGACPVCRLGLDIRHTDVLILSQFVRSTGNVLPRRVTGLCGKSHRKISKLVKEAQRAGLMANLQPPTGNKDPHKRYKWKGCNTYFETEEELYWKEIDTYESYYYEKPPPKKILQLKDIL